MPSTNDTQALSASWMETCRGEGIAEEAAWPAFSDLLARYTGPDRFYHSLAHVAAMLRTVTVLQTQIAVPDLAAVQLAVWFHDAIYDTRAADNEEQSAEYAAATLGALGSPEHVVSAVRRLILATKRHQAAPDDVACQILLDADLAILGAPASEYEAYVRNVRREYAWVPKPDWRVGRAKVLAGFLQRPHIYQTPPMRAEREQAAQQNLRREWEALT